MKQVSEGFGAEGIPTLVGTDSRLLSRIWMFAIQTFFVGMLVLPTIFQLQRGVALAVLTGVATPMALRYWRVHHEILFLWSATMVVGVSGIAWGVINEAPGAFRVSTVYLIWPAAYLLFIGLAHGLPVMRRLESALLLGISLATAMVLIGLLAGLLGFGDIVYPLLAFQGVGFSAQEGFVEFRTFNLTTVMYGFPFVLSLVVVRRGELRGLRKSGIYLLLFAIVLSALGSGRRAFWLIMLLTPFITLPFLQLSSCRLRTVPFLSLTIKSAVLATSLIAGVIAGIGLDPIALVEVFFAAFQGQEASSGARYHQASSLWEAFTESPVIGHGLGNTVDVLRSHDAPWAYELSYLALLMNVGLVGFLIYSAAVVWVALKGIVLSKNNAEFAKLFIPLITALCAFLILNSTNPYLGKFDYLWVIFLPVALINAQLTDRRKV
ncbi:MAG: hypothetical protein WDZ30_07780 [Cellvibrionaceae bacterium]